jgi:integrase
LRAFESPQVQPQHVKPSEGGRYRLRVPEGKDTRENGGKPRDDSLPADVERALQQLQNAENIAPRGPGIELSERGVRVAVKRTAKAAAEEPGDEDFRHVSSHDLRRRFAQRLLVDRQVSRRVLMQVGGWYSFQAIEPSLDVPIEDAVDEAFEEAGRA